MSARNLPKGLQAFGAGDIDFDANTIKAMLLRVVSDTCLKAVTGATNATPIVLTITAHGWANGDLILIQDVGGNQSANGIFKVANQAANTVELTREDTGANVVGSGAYTSGGWAINLTQLDFIDDISAGRVGTDQTLGTKTNVEGKLGAADPSWTAVADPGSDVVAVVGYKDTGAEASSIPFVINDGRIRVTVAADAASSATTLWVEDLDGAIPSGTAIAFTNGVIATLTAPAAAGARSLAVSALSGAITAGNYGEAKTTSAGLPVRPNGGTISLTIDATSRLTTI